MRNVKILVEGYHDRAFLSGWLKSRGFIDPGLRSGGGRKQVMNPITNERVVGGNYAWRSATDASFVEIVPAGGTRLLQELPALVRRAPSHDPDELVVVLDVDDVDAADGVARRRQGLANRLAAFAPTETSPGVYRLSNGLVVRLLLWASSRPVQAAVPAMHNLERLVCAALSQAYPQRSQAVASWLGQRPDVPAPDSAKAHTWSFMAGWYAEQGCEAFLMQLWEDPSVAAALSDDLHTSGAEAVIAALD